MRAVMYGAGNIGRGFIGAVFARSGYEVTFIDIAKETVTALRQEGRYPVRVLSDMGSKEDTWIEGVRAVDGRDLEQASDAIAGADIMATAVGVRALPLIAPVIAEGLRKRFVRSEAPLNIIICENLINANRILAGFIKEHLNGKDGMPLEDLITHIQDLLCRFSNRALGDTCARVDADTERKLGPKDRFIGALKCCGEQGVIPAFISAGAAAAFFCHSRERGLTQAPKETAEELAKITKLPGSSPEAERIRSLYRLLAEGREIAELRQTAMRNGRKPVVV